jgi:C-terminal processing protease CtpA/Prc
VVAGERTYGKGTAQAVVPGVDEPGARYATVASVRLAGGEGIEGRGVIDGRGVIEGKGVSPDVAL